MPIANARMYSATPAQQAAWRKLLAWVLADAGLSWEVIDYEAPAPLQALWARQDLGLVQMCGLPFARRLPAAQIVAAPVPSPARYERRPVYRTDIVVRSGSPYQSLEDTFGGVAGYTMADSLSGGVAFEAYLRTFRTPARQRLYERTVGGLVNARGVIEALARGDIDVGPLDSYSHDLLRQADPVFAAQVRTIAATPWRPIPPLVATAPLADGELQRLRHSLAHVASESSLADERASLLLAGFAFPGRADYEPLADLARTSTSFEEL